MTKEVRQAIFEHFLVDEVQVYWILKGDPQYAFVPAGSNDEIEITLAPKHWRARR